jgi:hypothetical protein
MTWDKPNTPLKWLILFAPPAMCVVTTIAGDIFDREYGDWIAWAFCGFFLATISSLFISGWITRKGASLGAQFACCIGWIAIYTLVDCAILFAAFTVGSRVLPMPE